jgi:hypothetical protein
MWLLYTDCSVVEVSVADGRNFADTLLRPALPFKAVLETTLRGTIS